MATLLFIVVHLLAWLVNMQLLVITIPLHVIYGAIVRRLPDQRANKLDENSYMRCPDCAELILRAARKCKHCGRAVSPAGKQYR